MFNYKLNSVVLFIRTNLNLLQSYLGVRVFSSLLTSASNKLLHRKNYSLALAFFR